MIIEFLDEVGTEEDECLVNLDLSMFMPLQLISFNKPTLKGKRWNLRVQGAETGRNFSFATSEDREIVRQQILVYMQSVTAK